MSYSPKSRFQVAILSLVLLSIPFVNSGCAKAPTVNQVLTNVVAKSFMVNSDEWVGVTATFNTAGFMLASINVPVTDPNNLSITYGQFSLIPFLCSGACQGGGNISISVNLTQLAHVQGQPAILPNGTALPIAGFNPALMVALPIGNTSSRIYYAFAPGIALLGTAMTFSQLDPAGKYVPGVDIFTPFQAGPLAVTAGMFFGSNTNTTGAGFFMDLSSLINKPTPTPSSQPSVMAFEEKAPEHSLLQALTSNSAGEFHNQVKFLEVKPSSMKEEEAYRKIYELNNQKLTLEIK